ncbi:MAG TPA: PAS domain S-box protein [Syntrophales bacterium]|nr:PAS domain S-box protein [Syntrophales bacterium]
MDKKAGIVKKGLKWKFLLTGLFVLVLSALILIFVSLSMAENLSPFRQIVLVFALIIILAGLVILFLIFNSVYSEAESLKEAVEQSSWKTMELNAIKDIANTAFQNRDFEEFLNAFLDKALTVTNAEIGSSFVVDPSSRRLRLVGSRGIEGLEKGAYINIDDSLIKHVIDEGKPLLVKDIESDARFQKKNDPKYGSPSFLSVPVHMGQKGNVTAVFNLSHKKAGATFDTRDETIISTMLVEIRLTLENALLQSQIGEYIKEIEEHNVNLAREINNRKQIEASIRESETKFRELADLLPQTVFETDLKGNFMFTNRSAFELFGYSQEDFAQGLNAFQMFIPEDRDRLRRDAQMILNGKYLGGLEYTALKKDGTAFPVTVYASPISRVGNATGVRGIAIDMTEQKRTEEIQKKLHEDLIQAEKLATVGTFVAGIAHEIKNPLAIIIQGVEYLKDCTGPDELVVDVVDRVMKSAIRADSIVKGLLSFTRQTPIQTEEADIIPVIEETLSFIEYQLTSRHINVVRKYSPALPMVNIDSNQIKQVFINILLNSVEAMEDVGTITIIVEEIKDDFNQRYLQIVFADTGFGIYEDNIEKVFDPFFTTKDNWKNTGLGLSITKGIIGKHRGIIQIESEVGKGTRVIIRLPINDKSEKSVNPTYAGSRVIAS